MPRGYREWDGGGSISTPFYDSRDIDAAARAIFLMADWIDDTSIPLAEAKEIAREDMSLRFITQVDPLGKPWVKLTDAYAAEKQREVGFITPILTREWHLRDAATDPSAWFVEGDAVMFSTAGLPDYWAYHQQEGGRYPKMTTFISRKTVKSLGIYKGKARPDLYGKTVPYDKKVETERGALDHGMPQRSFIGLSDEAQTEIALAIDRWFSAGLELGVKEYERSGGGSVTRYFNITDFPTITRGAGGRQQYHNKLGQWGPMV